MNMMTEVDILLIKQIELKYLTKIKKLLYLLAVDGLKAPNISNLAGEIETSRATVMNYIKYLSDARLINIMYHPGDEFPKKPSKVMMYNPNLMYCIYPIVADRQEVMETFFVNMLWKEHSVNQATATPHTSSTTSSTSTLRVPTTCDAHATPQNNSTPPTTSTSVRQTKFRSGCSDYSIKSKRVKE